MASSSRLQFGIAGWAYDDWKDVVYPKGCRDTLRFCAEFVDFIEVNSTFYHIPLARNCESWVRRTEEFGTRFSAKLPQEFTHRLSTDPVAARETCHGFDPLACSGRLATLLAQFSYRFERTARNTDHLRWLRDSFAAVAPLTVEVRHATWATPAALEVLRELDFTVANLDYPGGSTGFGVHATGINGPNDLAYFRVHGRNADAWFDKDAGRDQVYDYEYSSSEVAELGRRADELAHAASAVVVVANNHFQGKAMKLVLQLLAAYRKCPVPVPDPLLAAYPDLRAIAAHPPGRLF